MPDLPDLATFMLVTSVRAAILLSVATLISFFLRRSKARARLLLWTGALVGCLMLPVLGPAIPKEMRTALPLLSRPESLVHSLPGKKSADESPAPLPPRPVRPIVEDSSPTPSREQSRSLESSAPSRRWDILLLASWWIGVLLVSTRIAVGHLRIRILGKRTTRLEGAAWQSDLEEAAALAGTRRRVVLGISSKISTPITWGFWKPRIVLPDSAHSWCPERRQLVLLHELIHIRRGDWLARLLAQLACASYWFNPLAWIAARRLTVEQELACDDEVLARGTRASTYAGHLLAIARSTSAQRFEPLAALHMARRSQMEARLMSILDATRSRSRPALWAPALLFLAGMIPLLAAVEPWADGRADEEAASRSLTEITEDLEVLEADLQPYERELEQLEVQLRPFENRLREAEKELEPYESEVRALEEGFEPFEQQAAALELELEPYELALAEAEQAMQPFEDELAAIEARMQPFAVELARMEAEMEPFEAEAEQLERKLEPYHRDGERAEAEIEALHERLERQFDEARARGRERDSETARNREAIEHSPEQEQAAGQMRAVRARLRAQYDSMTEIHAQMRPLYEEMSRTRQKMEPAFRRMREIHREMEPVYSRMASARQAMEPTYRKLEAEHRQMQSHYRKMEDVQREMEPVYRAMEETHERMRPVYRDMEKLQRELDRAIRSISAIEIPD